MNEREAIKYWEVFLKEIEFLKQRKPSIGWEEQEEATKLAIEALEKQIPKKPTEKNEIEDGVFYRLDFLCPACKNATIGQPYKPNYCKHCGQKLDWTVEE